MSLSSPLLYFINHMDLFVSNVKLGILQYCHEVRSTPPRESVIGCIVGEELGWSENQAIVSFVAEVCNNVEEKSKLLEKCETLNKNIAHYRDEVDAVTRKMRSNQQDSIIHAHNLETELGNVKENNLVLSAECERSRKELSKLKAKLIDVEMYMDSDDGGLTRKLEEELAVAKLRLAELETEKDDWEMNGKSGS